MRDVFDPGALERAAAASPAAFLGAKPYPHLVIDGFLKPEIAEQAAREWPSDSPSWKNYFHINERKRILSSPKAMGPKIRAIFDALESPEFFEWIEKVTGIGGLISDPDRDGTGLHETSRGGWLNIHADFLVHAKRPWLRRELNALLYLSEDWDDSYGGHLEMWDKPMKNRVQNVAPRFNRLVLFKTEKHSWHGHPAPLACPEDKSRRSLILYFFKDVGRKGRVQSTNYRPTPEDRLLQRFLIHLDRRMIYAYSLLKRYTPASDKLATKLLSWIFR